MLHFSVKKVTLDCQISSNVLPCLNDKINHNRDAFFLISAKGIKYLFPVQVETYKKVLEGEDTIAKARTGTGKTVSYNRKFCANLRCEFCWLC